MPNPERIFCGVKGHLAAGGISGLKLHDWKDPAFSEASGFGFLVKMSSYNRRLPLQQP